MESRLTSPKILTLSLSLYCTPAAAAKPKEKPVSANIKIYEQKLSGIYAKKVTLRLKKNGKGEIIIPFASEKELKELTERLEPASN